MALVARMSPAEWMLARLHGVQLHGKSLSRESDADLLTDQVLVFIDVQAVWNLSADIHLQANGEAKVCSSFTAPSATFTKAKWRGTTLWAWRTDLTEAVLRSQATFRYLAQAPAVLHDVPQCPPPSLNSSLVATAAACEGLDKPARHRIRKAVKAAWYQMAPEGLRPFSIAAAVQAVQAVSGSNLPSPSPADIITAFSTPSAASSVSVKSGFLRKKKRRPRYQ
jgi:hypothetical protein